MLWSPFRACHNATGYTEAKITSQVVACGKRLLEDCAALLALLQPVTRWQPNHSAEMIGRDCTDGMAGLDILSSRVLASGAAPGVQPLTSPGNRHKKTAPGISRP